MTTIINPIYRPSGRAQEYGEWALNINTGCPFRCTYCYCPNVLRISKEQFHSNYHPRPGIIEAVEKQLKKGGFESKLIHLCFIGDPYGSDDTTPTREIIKLIKNAGANVQILTKGGYRAVRDFDLLDSSDWFGITLTSSEPVAKIQEPFAALTSERINTLYDACGKGIKTWISIEPVLEPKHILEFLSCPKDFLNPLFKIGKLNHVKNDTDWKSFGLEAERICKENGYKYYIKADLRREMER